MHIAQIAPLAESVPPKLYGGTERVVHWLTEELIAQGHQVTLFASGNSKTRATLVPSIAHALRLARPRHDPSAACAALLADVAAQAASFDVLHAHIDWIHLPLLQGSNVPFLTTLHGRLDLPGLAQVVRRFPAAPFVSISDNQRLPLPGLRWLKTIQHGLPREALKPSYERGSYLAFLGRLAPEKGPDIAIRIATQSNMQLRIAAKLPRGQTRFFKEQLQPLINGSDTELIGEVNDHEKEGFLQNAAALLFPYRLARAVRAGDD